jgi:hypothetical protein
MPSTVMTGRDVTFTLDSSRAMTPRRPAPCSAARQSSRLTRLSMVAHIESVDTQWTFTIELLQDWGAAGSLFEAMWADAEAAANTTLSQCAATA